MDELKFLKGLKNNLPSGEEIIVGAIYVTTDDGGIYLGAEADSGAKILIPLIGSDIEIDQPYLEWTTFSATDTIETASLEYPDYSIEGNTLTIEDDQEGVESYAIEVDGETAALIDADNPTSEE